MVKWISLLAMNDMTLMLISFNLGFCSQQIARFLQHDKLPPSLTLNYHEIVAKIRRHTHLLIIDQV